MEKIIRRRCDKCGKVLVKICECEAKLILWCEHCGKVWHCFTGKK